MDELYADLVLPLPLGRLYTYRVPAGMEDRSIPGVRAVVQFGKQKLYTGIIRNTHHNRPEHYKAKPIIEIPDQAPIVTPLQFRLWEWMADYYLCTLGEIMNAALPAGMKLQSETVMAINPETDISGLLLTREEDEILKALSGGKAISVTDAGKLIGSANPLPLLRKMVDEGLLLPQEELRDAFQSRQITYVKLSEKAEDPVFTKQLFEQLEKKAPKQLDLLMSLMKLQTGPEILPLKRQKLLKAAGATAAVLQQLVTKGIAEIYEADESHAFGRARGSDKQVMLTETQKQACNAIYKCFEQDKPVLLHGVTSSGKTEVYIRLINDMIGKGKQVIYLLPEIALTTQIIGRLRDHFGDQLLVYHSRFSAGERAEVYMKVLNDGKDGNYKFPIVVGARSAVFLPYQAPGLIIVDEEHDSSYKQMDPAPRYNARDVAVVAARLYDSHVLMGSATPALESYYNVEQDKYHLVRMTERFGGLSMPEIEILDLRDAYSKGAVKSNFSLRLIQLMKTALEKKEQIILFQNRRGFAPVLECRNCGWIPHCVNCDVSLTYHKRSDHLRCHYCGYITHVPSACKACNHTGIRMKGIGTERIEDDVQMLFPDAVVQRLDLDTTSSKHSFQRILSGFTHQEIDILVGTQMVTKGLDFDNVSLVGVLNADHLIGFPDFRAVERSYQLLAQVAGRAGRKFKQGKVLIQTFQVKHPLLQFLVANDFQGFYRYETAEREKYGYPPFVRLVELRLRHRDEQLLNQYAGDFAKMLKNTFGKRVFGPMVPAVARVRNYYIQHILLKVEKGMPDAKIKSGIRDVTARFLSDPDHKSLFIQADVDPT